MASGRLIPAHAGKTHPSVYADQVPWAHPRSRGENFLGAGAGFSSAGSSPLTRGKHMRAITQAGFVRLIPAHAGKTEPRVRVGPCWPAHPRSRGENVSLSSSRWW